MTLHKIVHSKLYKLFIICGILVVLSLPQRIWKLESLPPIIVDEPAYARDIQSAIKNNNFNPAQPQWDGSQAFIDYYPALLLILTLHIDTILAQRISSVIYSIAGILIFFFLLRMYTNTKSAFLASLLFECSFFYLQFSRVGWNVIHAVVLGLGTLLFTLLAAKHTKYSVVLSILSAIFASLCFYTYRSGEIYIAASFLIYIIEILAKKKYKLILPFAVFISVFFVLSLPWLHYILNNYEFYMLRNSVVSITHVSFPYMEHTHMTQVYLYQVATTLKTWILMLPVFGFTGHIENARYIPLVFPMMSVFLIPLYWIGFLLLIKHLKTYYPFLFIFATGLLFSQILTVYPPNGARGLIVLPILYFAIGLALYTIFKKCSYSKKINLLLFVSSFCIAVIDIVFYFYWMTWIQV
ncbi:MAG: glycosyltransferase family 39 protein [Candidatus Levybacteria bacterium]|nr:glycosyltransferase family 39 protein [Candidatus Levybacteria bacterium]